MTGMTKFEKPAFEIIRRRGMPKYAYLPDGTRVERSMQDNGFEAIFVPERGGFVRCASYSDHFIYEVPAKLARQYEWARGASFRCTCGSYAVFSGLSGYEQDASPQGIMFVCHHHALTGVHATGGSRWV